MLQPYGNRTTWQYSRMAEVMVTLTGPFPDKNGLRARIEASFMFMSAPIAILQQIRNAEAQRSQ